jgi:hypothetical protein
MDITPEKITKARDRGFNDQEILDHISQEDYLTNKLAIAKKQGYSATEVLDYLKANPSTLTAQTTPDSSKTAPPDHSQSIQPLVEDKPYSLKEYKQLWNTLAQLDYDKANGKDKNFAITGVLDNPLEDNNNNPQGQEAYRQQLTAVLKKAVDSNQTYVPPEYPDLNGTFKDNPVPIATQVQTK